METAAGLSPTKTFCQLPTAPSPGLRSVCQVLLSQGLPVYHPPESFSNPVTNPNRFTACQALWGPPSGVQAPAELASFKASTSPLPRPLALDSLVMLNPLVPGMTSCLASRPFHMLVPFPEATFFFLSPWPTPTHSSKLSPTPRPYAPAGLNLLLLAVHVSVPSFHLTNTSAGLRWSPCSPWWGRYIFNLGKLCNDNYSIDYSNMSYDTVLCML